MNRYAPAAVDVRCRHLTWLQPYAIDASPAKGRGELPRA